MIAAIQDIRNAYDARDRDALERALERIEQAMRYTGPVQPAVCAKHGDALPCGECAWDALPAGTFKGWAR